MRTEDLGRHCGETFSWPAGAVHAIPAYQAIPSIALSMAQAGIQASSLLPSNLRVTRASSSGAAPGPSTLTAAAPRTKKKTHLLPLLLLLLPLLPQILMLPLLLPLGMRSFTHCTVRWSMPTAYQT